MSELRLETWSLPAADLGTENHLPPINRVADAHAQMQIDPSVALEDREHLGWGQPRGLLPYRLQDGYDRGRTPRGFRVAVLENETLRAAFFLELGGRLWSLVHKPTGRELLAANPVFQPCNLGLRNAWISGGVEWNIGWAGHWPYTCAPLFAARVRLPDGTPGLRMWEWERVRQVPFQIDAWLPDGSPVLLVRVAIRNPHAETVPMYWWSNIAVQQHARTRVIVPANQALTGEYVDDKVRLTCVPVPLHRGRDNSLAAADLHASDLFYRMPHGVRPWITALEPDGRGLFQTSTPRLSARKLFRWGVHNGGQSWQSFLGTPDYIEIQAGLIRTQGHHIPMPAGATWSWVEAYGDLQLDPAVSHGADWEAAQRAVAAGIEAAIPAARLDAALAVSESWAATPATELLQEGSGWGALEAARRQRAGEPAMELPGSGFPASSLGADQAPWLALLDAGRLPERLPGEDPGCYMVQEEWMERLGRSLATPANRHWLALFHYGCMQWHRGQYAGATLTWLESLRRSRSLWACHALGEAARLEGRKADAVPWLKRAWQMRPDLRPLAAAYLSALLAAGRAAEALRLIRRLPQPLRDHGRIRMLEGEALLKTGRLDALEKLLAAAPVASDQREGETGLSDLWFGLYGARAEKAAGKPLDAEARR